MEDLCVKCCCMECGMVMDSYLVDEICKLYVCGNLLVCFGIYVEVGIFKIKGYDGLLIECDKCGSDMEFKNGCFGKYFDCINSECKNICKLFCNGEFVLLKEDLVDLLEFECEKSDVCFMFRDGVFGIFLVVYNFFKLWEIRVFKVEELVCFWDCILFKFYYLVDVFKIDLDGNLVIVCFSCKIK